MSELQERPISPRVDGNVTKESIKKGIILWENDRCQVIAPENPLTPNSEGTHIRVIPKDNIPPFWKPEGNPKDILYQFGIGLGVAKFLTESGLTKEMWTNIQLLGEWGGQHTAIIDVFGRALENETVGKSWGSPVSMPENSILPDQELTTEEVSKLKRAFQLYLPLWNKAINNLQIFSHGVITESNSSLKQGEETIWSDANYFITYAGKPHVEGGGHLVVHRKPEKGIFTRIWQSLPEALEMLSLDLATVQLLYQEGILPENPNVNIHFSGNWALPYAKRDEVDPNSKLTEYEKGLLYKLELSSQDTARSKRSDKKEAVKGFYRLSTHGHIYWTRENERIDLPDHPDKGTYKWSHSSKPLSQETIGKIREILQQKLTPVIEQKFKGRVSK